MRLLTGLLGLFILFSASAAERRMELQPEGGAFLWVHSKVPLGSVPIEITLDLPEGINAAVDKKNTVTLTGINKELLGQTAASIRSLRPPEPYKGKGIKYAEEYVQRKAGKTGTK